MLIAGINWNWESWRKFEIVASSYSMGYNISWELVGWVRGFWVAIAVGAYKCSSAGPDSVEWFFIGARLDIWRSGVDNHSILEYG